MDNVRDVRKMYINDLRKSSQGSQAMWSKAELLAGLTHFFELHDRFPTSHEIDAFEYLPSARSIQRSYGGLVKLRGELLPDEIANYTTGAHRSTIAKQTFANGRSLEKQFYEYLTTIFKEIAVHEHKLIRPGNVSSDFYIYLNETTGIVIDIFYAESMINLVNIVNIKLKRYILIEPETYLVVVGNPAITQHDLDSKTNDRRIPLPDHIQVVTETYFKDALIRDLRHRSMFQT